MSIRTCLVTGKKGNPENFFRFTIVDGVLLFDEVVKNPGRGGYVLREPKVLEKLKFLSKKIVHFMKVKKVVIEEGVIELQKSKIFK